MNRRLTPRPDAICRRSTCSRPYAEHVADACPDGAGTFKRLAPSRTRASTSMSAREVDVLAGLMQALQRGGDPRTIAKTHRAECNAIHSKAQAMREQIARAKT